MVTYGKMSMKGSDSVSYEKSKNELYAEQWFKDNGFEVVELKQYTSKTKYVIKKNNVEMKWDLPYCVTDIKAYMNFCGEQFSMYYYLLKSTKNSF